MKHKVLSEVKEGKTIEINGYDYVYQGIKKGKEKEIRGFQCYVYVSPSLQKKNLPCEKWFIVDKTHDMKLKLINFKYVLV